MLSTNKVSTDPRKKCGIKNNNFELGLYSKASYLPTFDTIICLL
jgi:hypothetical protein